MPRRGESRRAKLARRLARVLSCLAAARTASTAAAAAATRQTCRGMAACSDRLRAATTGAAEGWHPQQLLCSPVCCCRADSQISYAALLVSCSPPLSEAAAPLLCRGCPVDCRAELELRSEHNAEAGGPPAELRGGGVSTNPYQRKIRCFHLAVCRLRSSAENSPLQSPHPQENQQLRSAA